MKEILELIESVDPSDTAKLDEIDARVWCWLGGHGFMHMYEGFGSGFNAIWKGDHATWIPKHWAKELTRSRDALKAIKQAEPNQILTGLQKYKSGKPDYADWRHPTTWLNDQGWNDVYEPKEMRNAKPTNNDRAEAALQSALRDMGFANEGAG